jgi:hypothetical protein
VAILIQDDRRDAVMARVPPETAALLANPPLATVWIDFAHMIHITHAIEMIGGMPAVRDFIKRAIDDAKGPHLRVLQGLLRLFGTSPATIFKRMNEMVKHTIENNTYTYVSTGERSGTMDVHWLMDGEVPTCMFVGPSVTLHEIFDACGAKGIVGPAERLGPTAARFQLRW